MFYIIQLVWLQVNNSDNEDAETEETGDTTKEEASYGITTITQNTSIQDYFAKKMAELKKGRKSPPKQSSENEEDSKESIEESNQDNDVELKEKKRKKKKDKRKKMSDNNDDCSIPKAQEEDAKETNLCKKRSSSCVEESIEQMDKILVSGDDTQDVSPRKKKCKGKRRENDSEVVTGDCIEQIDSSETSGKKSKKKKKENRGIE